jgi:tetratricopeptide (TPR) repeat protein
VPRAREGRYEPAASAFEQAVRADDRAAAYHYFLGRAYGAQAQRASMMTARRSLGRRRAEVERAVQLDPEFLDAREGLMQYYLQAPGFMGGSPQKAREQAHEVRKRAPYRGALLYATLAARRQGPGGRRARGSTG